MKILLVTEYFYPQSNGGTELYVYNLTKSLQKQFHQVEVLSVSDSEHQQIEYNGITVHYIPFNKNLAINVITGKEPADNLACFIETIQKINPYVVHFHTLTTSISAFHIEITKQRGFKTVFTSHIASAICLRGTLIQNGKNICNGKVENQKCLSCYLQKQGIPEPLNQLAAFTIRTIKFPKNLTKVVDEKQKELIKLKINLDKLVVVSNWQKAIFKKNNFNEVKTALCRQAVETYPTIAKKNNRSKLTIGFLGRLSATKGLHVLLTALQKIPTDHFELKVAVIPILAEAAYYRQQKKHIQNMPNAIWTENLPNENIGNFLSELDILCVPSQWLETGPFVVYEALAQGIPVLGSDLGGIKELITEGKNGWLFPYQNIPYLTELVTSLIIQKTTGSLLKNVEPLIRPVKNLADEMLTIYKDLIINDRISTSN